MIFLLTSCGLLQDSCESAYKIEGISNSVADKADHNSCFLREDLKGPESYPEQYIDFTVYTHGSDDIKDLFKITSSVPVEKNPEFIEDNRHIYMYFPGEILEGTSVYNFDENDQKLSVIRYDSNPLIVQYSKETGEVSEVNIKNPNGTIVLDAFSYNDKLIYLAEKRTKSFLLPLSGTWKESKGYISINNKKLKFPIVGNTALNIKGCLIGDEYYFPAISGIYKIDLKNNKVTQCLETNYGYFDYVQIVNYNDGIIVIQEKVYAYGDKSQRDYTTSIIRYTSDFKQTESANLDIRIDNVVCSSDGAMITERMYNYLSTVFQKSLYVDFNTLETIATDNEYVSEGNSVSPYWYFDSSARSFSLIDTNSNECKMTFENGKFVTLINSL